MISSGRRLAAFALIFDEKEKAPGWRVMDWNEDEKFVEVFTDNWKLVLFVSIFDEPWMTLVSKSCAFW